MKGEMRLRVDRKIIGKKSEDRRCAQKQLNDLVKLIKILNRFWAFFFFFDINKNIRETRSVAKISKRVNKINELRCRFKLFGQ